MQSAALILFLQVYSIFIRAANAHRNLTGIPSYGVFENGDSKGGNIGIDLSSSLSLRLSLRVEALDVASELFQPANCAGSV